MRAEFTLLVIFIFYLCIIFLIHTLKIIIYLCFCDRYPTNAEYTQVAKALMMKYSFFRDMEGDGFVSVNCHTFIYILIFR